MGAVMPNPQPFNTGAQFVAAESSFSGVYTLARGGSLEAAAQAARKEGLFMAGLKAGTGSPVGLPQVASGAVSTAKLVSAGSGCN